MSGSWRKFDLGGGGLQAANLEISRRLRRRSRAYALAALYPLGLHRDYLGDPRGGWCYRAATALTAAAAMAHPAAFAIGAAAITVAAIADLVRMESRVAAANKQLRMAVLLGQSADPPPGYAGRGESASPDGITDAKRSRQSGEPVR